MCAHLQDTGAVYGKTINRLYAGTICLAKKFGVACAYKRKAGKKKYLLYNLLLFDLDRDGRLQPGILLFLLSDHSKCVIYLTESNTYYGLDEIDTVDALTLSFFPFTEQLIQYDQGVATRYKATDTYVQMIYDTNAPYFDSSRFSVRRDRGLFNGMNGAVRDELGVIPVTNRLLEATEQRRQVAIATSLQKQHDRQLYLQKQQQQQQEQVQVQLQHQAQIQQEQNNRRTLFVLSERAISDVYHAYYQGKIHPALPEANELYAMLPKYSNSGFSFCEYMICVHPSDRSKRELLRLMTHLKMNGMSATFIASEIARIRSENDGTLPFD